MSTQERDASKRSIGKRVANWLGFILIQCVLVLVLLEVVGRVFDPLGISYYPETARFFDTMIKEEPIGYRCQPGMSGRFHNATYTINSLGLRDDEFPVEKPKGEKRILMLGDSHVFGLGVDDDDCIPKVAERLANEDPNSEMHYRIINMGVPSYNTEQELVQLKTLGVSLDPDAVLLRFSKNDIESKMWVFDKRASRLANFAQRSYAACLLFTVRRQVKQKLGSPQQVISIGDYQDGNPRWMTLAKSLAEINQICVDAGIPLLVLVPESLDDMPYPMLVKVAKNEGFRIESFVPFDDARWKHLDPSDLKNSRTDSHANKQGCLINGTKLYEVLMDHGFIGTSD